MQLELEGQVAKETFFFENLPNKVFETKPSKEVLAKWGLADTLKIGSFRFNQTFQDYEAQTFLCDLFNSPNVRYVINSIFAKESVGTVEFKKLRCHELTMEMFDSLEKQNIVKGGFISKIFSQNFEGIQICDKLRECLILEESENYCVFNESQRNELLLKLFTLLVIGGSLNQYEDLIEPYLEWSKTYYKGLVSVRKRAETGEVFVEANAYQITSIDQGKVYKQTFNPQDVLYVVVNPSIRTVHVVLNQWQKFW